MSMSGSYANYSKSFTSSIHQILAQFLHTQFQEARHVMHRKQLRNRARHTAKQALATASVVDLRRSTLEVSMVSLDCFVYRIPRLQPSLSCKTEASRVGAVGKQVYLAVSTKWSTTFHCNRMRFGAFLPENVLPLPPSSGGRGTSPGPKGWRLSGKSSWAKILEKTHGCCPLDNLTTPKKQIINNMIHIQFF